MRIYLHIGPDATSSDRMQRVLDAKRDQMIGKGLLYARSPGAKNHTRLFMAVTDPDNVDSLRFNRGFIAPEKQQMLREDVARALQAEVARHQPETLILSAHHLGSTLARRSEIERLRALLLPLSDDIRVVAHLDDPARLLLRRYHAQLIEGRAHSLASELSCLEAKDFWQAAVETTPTPDPQAGQFAEVQGACFWLDYKRLQEEWEAVFGPGSITFHSLDLPRLLGRRRRKSSAKALTSRRPLARPNPKTCPAPPPPRGRPAAGCSTTRFCGFWRTSR